MGLTIVIVVLLVLLGAMVGHIASSVYEDRGKIKRFVSMDQQHYERWKAYCKLVSRIQDLDRKNGTDEDREKEENFG
jgi:Sec-independent protein translocase protein TatA